MNLTLRLKIQLLFSLIVIIGTVAIGYFSYSEMYKNVIGAAQVKVSSDLALGREYLNSHIPGDWTLQGGQLYKGTTLINDNFQVVDEITRLTGSNATIFQGNTRVSTSVKKADGTRAVGTKISDQVWAVVSQGQPYYGEADVVGTLNQTAYEPIKDPQGQIIGVWFVGVPNTPYEILAADFRNQILLFSGIQLILALLAAGWIAGKVTQPVRAVVERIRQIADGDGDLTQRIEAQSNDEIGDLIQHVNRFIDNIQQIIRRAQEAVVNLAIFADQLTASSQQTASAADEIATSMAEVAQGAQEQIQNAVSSAKAVEEVADGVRHIAATSNVVAEASMATEKAAQTGHATLERAIRQMKTIHEGVSQSTAVVNSLNQRSQEIGQILAVITGIADQTNLLALNAAIEAARAGDQGRGFAVVADEVRKLAEQSANSANQIRELIGQIQQDTQAAVSTMNRDASEVEEGLKVINETGDAFQNILAAAQKAVAQIQEVTAASHQINLGSRHVSEAVGQMVAVAQRSSDNFTSISAATEETLSSMQEVASSIDALNRMSQDLRDMVGRFRA